MGAGGGGGEGGGHQFDIFFKLDKELFKEDRIKEIARVNFSGN